MARSSLMVMNPDEMLNLADMMVNTVRQSRPDSTANEILDVIVCTTAALSADICKDQTDIDKCAKEIGDALTYNILLMLEQAGGFDFND